MYKEYTIFLAAYGNMRMVPGIVLATDIAKELLGREDLTFNIIGADIDPLAILRISREILHPDYHFPNEYP